MTIETLDKAISRGLQVSFTYNSYDIDKKLHPRKNSEGEVRNYTINPYQIVATNGRYYLLSVTMTSMTVFRTIASTESQILSFSTHLQSRRERLRESKTDLTCPSTLPSICICLQAKSSP